MDTEIEQEWQIIDKVFFWNISSVLTSVHCFFFYNLSHAENIVWIIKGKITVKEIQGKLTIHEVRVSEGSSYRESTVIRYGTSHQNRQRKTF